MPDEQAITTQRLERSAQAVHAYRESYEAELEIRDRLIIEAADAGIPWRQIAQLADISQSRINQIILRWSTAPKATG